ncbi:hypothetical protein CHY08_14470 [Rhizobium leguminosarum bv. viciae]|nr:hypothetical protein CHY08_14470 [Rhizobium leguminosarum bv. viciae]
MTQATRFPSFLCSSQESSASKSLGAKDTSRFIESITAPTRGGWIPVTSLGRSPRKGMRVERLAAYSQAGQPA